MLAEAAADLEIGVHVLTPHRDDPAVRCATSVVLAELDDIQATRRLADACGAISFENEWVPIDRLGPLEQAGVRFLPALEALSPLITKRGQREWLDRLHLPSPRWCGLEAVLEPPQPKIGRAHV